MNNIRYDAAQARREGGPVRVFEPTKRAVIENMKNIYMSIRRRNRLGFKFFDYEISTLSWGGLQDPAELTKLIAKTLREDGYEVVTRGFVMRIIWTERAETKQKGRGASSKKTT